MEVDKTDGTILIDTSVLILLAAKGKEKRKRAESLKGSQNVVICSQIEKAKNC